jgi:ribosomal protein S18 acetylase RimI-like enzyme
MDRRGADPAGGVTVAVRDAEVVGVGMMALSRDGQRGWIDQLYLHPSAVGQGIGSQFLARAKHDLGLPIRLYTFQDNTASRRFYERHGFQPLAFSDGRDNEERCPDVLYELNCDRGVGQLGTDRRPRAGEDGAGEPEGGVMGSRGDSE